MWVLEGLVTVSAARAALLDLPPPRVNNLLSMVGGVKDAGWYTSGARIEAYMKTARRMQFYAAYGPTEGEAKWLVYYTNAKGKGGHTCKILRARRHRILSSLA